MLVDNNLAANSSHTYVACTPYWDSSTSHIACTQRRHLKLNSFCCHSKLHWAVCSDQERIYCCYCSCRKAKQSVFYYLEQRCSLCVSCQARWPKMLSSGRDSCTNCAQTCSFSLTVCRLLFPSVFVCFPVCLFVCRYAKNWTHKAISMQHLCSICRNEWKTT